MAAQGCRVQITSKPAQRGTLRWDGFVGEEHFLGIELDEMVPEGHDGQHPKDGCTYFKVNEFGTHA